MKDKNSKMKQVVSVIAFVVLVSVFTLAQKPPVQSPGGAPKPANPQTPSPTATPPTMTTATPATTPTATTATAATTTAPMPSVKKLLDDYVKAIGGEAAVRRTSRRVSKGTIEIISMGAKGTVEIFQQAPNKIALVTTLPGLGVFKEGFDGTAGWAQDPFSGLRDKSGAELARTKREASFYRDIEMAKIYPKMAVAGIEKINGRDAYVIEAAPAEAGSTPDKFYFDKETALIVRFDSMSVTPQGTIPVEAYLEDYKPVDSVKMPFTMRQSLAGSDIIIRLTEVKHDAPSDAAKFNKPTAP